MIHNSSDANLETRLEAVAVLPLLRADDPATALRAAQALVAGGLEVIEVLLRSERALECLEAVADGLPQATVGAGTVRSPDQAQAALDAGAQFLVSPGLDDAVVRGAQAHGLTVMPGVATATEAQRALRLGLRLVKFFPAAYAGGPALIEALSDVFPELRFVPSGGITRTNLGGYLALPAVLACAGTWLTPHDAVADGDFEQITRLAREAIEIARGAQRTRYGPGRE